MSVTYIHSHLVGDLVQIDLGGDVLNGLIVARLSHCAECGEVWPCSDSRHLGLRPTIRAEHRPRVRYRVAFPNGSLLVRPADIVNNTARRAQ